MSNIPGAAGVLPGVFSNVVTATRGASVPGSTRVACIIGTGQRSEIIIASAQGGGKDGLNNTFTSTTGADGYHFLLNFFPIISNRTQVFRNGVLLRGIETTVTPFNSAYDYRVDIATGRIEMQQAHLVDQGGSFYSIGSTNVGLGTIQNLTLPDVQAPQETWTIKCVSVQRNNLNQPIAGTANFVAFGSVSGNVLDANGNPTIWIANNTVTTNGVLSFSILETNASLPFREGDFFVIKVSSGILNKNDTLTAAYIAVQDINDPTFFTSLTDLAQKHGSSSLDNTLTLGAQLAFANSPPGIMALQAAPPLPRRTSYTIETNFPAASTNCNDFLLPLPLGVSPDPNSAIHFFVTNPATGIEKQLLPNKFTFFTLGTSGNPTVCNFVNDNVSAPAGNSFSYSVIQQNATINFAQDGYLNRSLTTQINATFSSASFVFTSDDVGRTLSIIDSTNLANIGSFAITGVTNGALNILANGTPPFADFINEGAASFTLVNSVTGANVPGASGTVSIVANPNTATSTMVASINLTSFAPFANGYKIRITAATNASNIGLFDITSFTGPSTLGVAKSFVSEHNLKFEIIDTTQISNYIVVNHNVVPNGYSLRVTLVDVKDVTFFDAGWITALATLETQEIDILVPLPKQTISVIFENCLTHCITMSSIRFKKERELFIGAINGLTPDNLTGAKFAAVEDIGVLEGIEGATISDILSGNTEDLANYSVVNAFGGTFRAVYFFPDQIVVQVGTQNQIIDGFYIAAAAAGFLSGVSNVAVPLTNKILSGFTILKNRMFRPVILESLAAAGVTVLQPVAGGGRVLWGKTTTQSGFPEEEEISIIFIRDRIAKSMRTGFAGFIGNPEDPDTTGTLTARGIALLNSFITQGLITNWANLTVKRDLVEPRQWDVSVSVQPVYPINWIYITLSVGTI
jgi:hypothetical protein